MTPKQKAEAYARENSCREIPTQPGKRFSMPDPNLYRPNFQAFLAGYTQAMEDFRAVVEGTKVKDNELSFIFYSEEEVRWNEVREELRADILRRLSALKAAGEEV